MSPQKAGGGIEAHGILRDQPRLPIETHVIAIILHWKPAYFGGCRLTAADCRLKCSLEVEILRPISRRVCIGDIGRDNLLPANEHIHIAFEIFG